MNKQQRKELEKIQERIADVQADIQSIRDDLEDIKAEEDEKYENLPDSFKYGEAGENMCNALLLKHPHVRRTLISLSP